MMLLNITELSVTFTEYNSLGLHASTFHFPYPPKISDRLITPDAVMAHVHNTLL